jgi:hypothetical protein
MITRNDIAAVTAGRTSGWDNVATALAAYFSDHLDRPEDDEEGEDGWGVWVIEQTNITLDAIAAKCNEVEAA